MLVFFVIGILVSYTNADTDPSDAMDDTQRMMQMGGFGFDASKSLGAEKDGLDMTQHDWVLPKFEQRAEAVLRKLSLGAKKDGLDMTQHDWVLPKFEQRAEAVLRKLVK